MKNDKQSYAREKFANAAESIEAARAIAPTFAGGTEALSEMAAGRPRLTPEQLAKATPEAVRIAAAARDIIAARLRVALSEDVATEIGPLTEGDMPAAAVTSFRRLAACLRWNDGSARATLRIVSSDEVERLASLVLDVHAAIEGAASSAGC